MEKILTHFSGKIVNKISFMVTKTLYSDTDAAAAAGAAAAPAFAKITVFTVVSTEAGAEAAGAAAAPAAAASVSEYKVFVTLNENFVNSFS